MTKIDDNIFSLDKSRFYIKDDHNGKKIFCKKSTEIEYNSLLFAKNLISTYTNLQIDNCSYNIIIPTVYNYENNIIDIEYFDGYNLESLLRNPNYHIIAVKYLNALFSFLLENGFNWVDFAPRNILINENNICLVDFEKGLTSTINDSKLYLQNHVYEEYSSFIFEKERLLSIDEVFSIHEKKDDKIFINSIHIKRCKFLCELLYDKLEITLQDYMKAWKMILYAEIPFILNDNMFFPRLYLSNLLGNKKCDESTYYSYASKIIEVNNSKNNEEKIMKLTRK